jgi:hypothetical protein
VLLLPLEVRVQIVIADPINAANLPGRDLAAPDKPVSGLVLHPQPLSDFLKRQVPGHLCLCKSASPEQDDADLFLE